MKRELFVAYSVHKEPVLINSCSVKEERGAGVCLGQEVGGKGCYPLEDRESSTAFEHEKRDSLL